MNAVYKIFSLSAACVILATAARAQDNSALSHQGVSTNSTTGVTVDIKTQPTLRWADHSQVSGLFVDCVQPRQTWSLLNPATPAPAIPPPQLELEKPTPVPVSDRDSDVVNRGPNFAVLRFSFP